MATGEKINVNINDWTRALAESLVVSDCSVEKRKYVLEGAQIIIQNIPKAD